VGNQTCPGAVRQPDRFPFRIIEVRPLGARDIAWREWPVRIEMQTDAAVPGSMPMQNGPLQWPNDAYQYHFEEDIRLYDEGSPKAAFQCFIFA